MEISDKNKENQVINSEINDFISKRPHWLIKYGNTIFLIVLLVTFLVGWFVKYPDIISATAKIVPSGYLNKEPDVIKKYGGEYVGQLKVSAKQFSAIADGQKVFLRFSAFPYQQYGSVLGTVNARHTVFSDSTCLVEVLLNKGLITTKKTPIEYKDDLFAEALIVTSETGLLKRMYNNIVIK
jgi:hypothetical protein